MTSLEQIELLQSSLDRIANFFGRVDAKATFIGAINSAMLALMAVNLNFGEIVNSRVLIPMIVAACFLALSLYQVYLSQFPQLKGGESSLIYFRAIAQRKEADFIDEFLRVSEAEYLKDMLGQVWRNSEILHLKFQAMKHAFVLSLCALPPWLIFLSVTAFKYQSLRVS